MGAQPIKELRRCQPLNGKLPPVASGTAAARRVATWIAVDFYHFVLLLPSHVRRNVLLRQKEGGGQRAARHVSQGASAENATGLGGPRAESNHTWQARRATHTMHPATMLQPPAPALT